jgi:hypothetical protein
VIVALKLSPFCQPLSSHRGRTPGFAFGTVFVDQPVNAVGSFFVVVALDRHGPILVVRHAPAIKLPKYGASEFKV